MKIIFLAALMFMACLEPRAQSAVAFSQTSSNPTGAYVNTAIDTVTITVLPSYSIVGIQPVITKVSGTVAGTAILYGSINGTNYVATGDTLTATNVTTNTAIWTKVNPAYHNYRVVFTGSGTMSATAGAKLIGRKP